MEFCAHGSTPALLDTVVLRLLCGAKLLLLVFCFFFVFGWENMEKQSASSGGGTRAFKRWQGKEAKWRKWSDGTVKWVRLQLTYMLFFLVFSRPGIVWTYVGSSSRQPSLFPETVVSKLRCDTQRGLLLMPMRSPAAVIHRLTTESVRGRFWKARASLVHTFRIPLCRLLVTLEALRE